MDSNLMSNEVSAAFSSQAMAMGARQKSGVSTVDFLPLAPIEGQSLKNSKAGEIARASEDVALSLSRQALDLAIGSNPPAKTIDAGAPKGASKRIAAYGGSQSLQEVKGAGFDASA